jgi:hypothetical protein
MLNEKEEALKYLSEAIQLNPRIIEGLEKSPELENLHDNQDFKEMIKRAQNDKAALHELIQEMEERGELSL